MARDKVVQKEQATLSQVESGIVMAFIVSGYPEV
jgi:hypothetical protein